MEAPLSKGKETTETVVSTSAKWLQSRYAATFLAAVSFAESVFLPIIIDPFLIAVLLAQPKRWRWFIGVAVVASTLGGIAAYLLGAYFFETIGTTLLGWYGLEESFLWVAERVGATGFVFVLIGAFTPIPYKLVALASGVLLIDPVTFITASFIGRSLRLGLVGGSTVMVGPTALPILRRHLHHFASFVGVVLIGYLLYVFLR